MDDLDTQIAKILQKDGRAPNSRIARAVGVSEGTVRRRLKHLIQEGFIQVLALPNPTKIGNDSEALIGVQVDPDKVDIVAEDISSLDEISWVTVTTGSFDIFAWVTLASAEALGIFLRTKVGVIPGIRRTETFVNLSNKRKSYGIVI